MASDDSDMTHPVTRGELKQEIADLEQRLEQKLEQKLERYATKLDLEAWGMTLLARIEQGERTMMAALVRLEQRLMLELGRHVRVANESSARIHSAHVARPLRR